MSVHTSIFKVVWSWPGNPCNAERASGMDTDDSIYVTEITRRVNELLAQGKNFDDIDTEVIENAIINSTDLVPDSIRVAVRRQGRKVRRSRFRTARQVRRNIKKVWGPALALLDDCLTIADLINARLVTTVFVNGDVLRSKDPRPIPDMVTGAYVKCLHLLALYGKSCRIASEAACLLRDGFPDGAISRVRTMHEHLAVLFVLHNDQTYELSEAYQDSAVFTRLKQVRADQMSFADPFWRASDTVTEELEAEIAELENAAAEIIARRAPKIRNQYEWARPILPEQKKNNPRHNVTFSDLEEAAGMDFLRRNYLVGNARVHADAYATINHFDRSEEISQIRQRRDDWAIYFTGSIIPILIGWSARAACRAIAWETEEYDELLYICEMQRAASAAADAFAKVNISSSLSA